MQWCDIERSVLLGCVVTSLAEQLPTFRNMVIHSSLGGKMFLDVRTSVPSHMSELCKMFLDVRTSVLSYTSEVCCFSSSETTHSMSRQRIPVEQILKLIRVFEMGLHMQPGTWLDTGFGSFSLSSFSFVFLFVFLEFYTSCRVTITSWDLFNASVLRSHNTCLF